MSSVRKSNSSGVDPRVRLAIARWPDDAPRGAVTTFCEQEGISRKTFYVLRARARADGEAAVLEPRSRRPRTSPGRISDQVRSQALDVRAALERSGLDCGPISVHDKMRAMGLKAPSPTSLARIFRSAGVARAEPTKRPRAAWRRFVYPAPNACWQTGRHRVRPRRRTQGRHLPAHRRPLPPGGGIPGRRRRDQPGGYRGIRPGRRPLRGAPAATDRQRDGPEPHPTRPQRQTGRATCAPWG